jgi:hypothetical protein
MCGIILSLFQVGEQRDDNVASPPLIVGDSRYSAAKPKARRPPTPNTLKKRKKGSYPVSDRGRSEGLEYYLGYLRTTTNIPRTAQDLHIYRGIRTEDKS